MSSEPSIGSHHNDISYAWVLLGILRGLILGLSYTTVDNDEISSLAWAIPNSLGNKNSN